MQESIFSPEDFRVPRTVSPGCDAAVRMTVRSGLKCCALSQNVGPVGSSERMLLASFQWRSSIVHLRWTTKALFSVRSETYTIVRDEALQAKRWHLSKRSDTRSRRLYFQLAPSVPRTGGTGFGLLPTMTVVDANGRGYTYDGGDHKKPRLSLAGVARGAMLPTPHANCHTGPGEHGTGAPNLQTVAGGSLNPAWIEAMQGYPVGWTDIGDCT